MVIYQAQRGSTQGSKVCHLDAAVAGHGSCDHAVTYFYHFCMCYNLEQGCFPNELAKLASAISLLRVCTTKKTGAENHLSIVA